MKIKDIKTFTWAVAISLFTVVGLGACNTGTEPGDTNVERGEIKEDQGEMVGVEGDQQTRYEERDTLENHYDHADHENHEDNKAKVIGDGGYDGKEGIERDEVDN